LAPLRLEDSSEQFLSFAAKVSTEGSHENKSKNTSEASLSSSSVTKDKIHNQIIHINNKDSPSHLQESLESLDILGLDGLDSFSEGDKEE